MLVRRPHAGFLDLVQRLPNRDRVTLQCLSMGVRTAHLAAALGVTVSAIAVWRDRGIRQINRWAARDSEWLTYGPFPRRLRVETSTPEELAEYRRYVAEWHAQQDAGADG